MLMRHFDEQLLILVKTYPQPSRKDRETTCVAAINRAGKMYRIFPVPFRLLEGDARFKKWEWIRARISKAANDHRPESHKIDCDTIAKLEAIGTQHEWCERLSLIKSNIVESFSALESRRLNSAETLGIVRPAQILGLDISSERQTEWTAEEKEKLRQESLFDSESIRQRQELRKLPVAFHYRYQDADGNILRHRITDWEVGALYWNCVRSHGPNWEKPLREKLEFELPSKDLMFLMGTIHRFPDQWLIVGLIYPPKPKEILQSELSFD